MLVSCWSLIGRCQLWLVAIYYFLLCDARDILYMAAWCGVLMCSGVPTCTLYSTSSRSRTIFTHEMIRNIVSSRACKATFPIPEETAITLGFYQSRHVLFLFRTSRKQYLPICNAKHYYQYNFQQQQSPGFCYCFCSCYDYRCHSPASSHCSEMLQAFANVLAFAVSKGRLSRGALLSVSDVQESSGMLCSNSSDIAVVQVYIAVSFNVDPNDLTFLEFQALKSAVQNAYNNLADDNCDPFRRYLVSVSFQGGSDELRLAQRRA